MGVITKLVYIKGLFLCILGFLIKAIVQNGDIFSGCQNFKYFFGVLEIPDIFWGWRVDAGPQPMSEEKLRVSPLGPKWLNLQT